MRKLSIIFLGFLLFSCEQVIQVDLNSSNPAIVIEANISSSPRETLVSITESTDFYNPNTYNAVSGADISVSDNQGNNFPFEEISPGKYANHNLSTFPNNKPRSK